MRVLLCCLNSPSLLLVQAFTKLFKTIYYVDLTSKEWKFRVKQPLSADIKLISSSTLSSQRIQTPCNPLHWALGAGPAPIGGIFRRQALIGRANGLGGTKLR